MFQKVTYTGSSFTTAVPASSGSLKLVTTVTDSRGRTASKETTVTVVAYSNPGISSFSVQRCNSSGTADDNGSYAKITYSYSISAVNNKNTASMKIEYKRSTATSWAGTLTSGSAYSASTSVVPTKELSSDYQWDIRITVADYFTSTNYTAILSSAEVIMDFLASGKGMAIGKTAELEETLDVGWDAIFRGAVTTSGCILANGEVYGEDQNITTKNASGSINLFAQGYNSGAKGLSTYAKDGTTAIILAVNQSNQIVTLATVACALTVTNTVTAASFANSSSRLVKENVKPISEDEARKLLSLKVVGFDYKDGFGSKGQYGLIAEDTMEILPHCVTVPEGYSEEAFDESQGRETQTLGIDYAKLVPHLIKMVQIQQSEIDELKRIIHPEVQTNEVEEDKTA